MESTKKNNKKKWSALALLLLGFALITGSLFAYFSDIVTGNGEVTAGTLDIKGEYKLYLNGSATALPSNTITNFNPGDIVVVKAEITNPGSKSAWIRSGITLSGALLTTNLPSPAVSTSVISVYEGSLTSAQIAGATKLTIPSGTPVYSDAAIINGTVETEGAGVSPYTAAYTIVFEALADNNAQDKAISITATTQALQYRNNTTTPDDAAWGTVVTTPFNYLP